MGSNCNVEYRQEGGERRFLAAFQEIQDISYEAELMSRGRVLLDVKSGGVVRGGGEGGEGGTMDYAVLSFPQPVVIRTATLMVAIHLATLIDAYCMVYTPIPHSRMSGSEFYSSSSLPPSPLPPLSSPLSSPLPSLTHSLSLPVAQLDGNDILMRADCECMFILCLSLAYPHPLTPPPPPPHSPPSPHRSGLYTTVEDDLSSRLRHSFVDPYYMQQAASELGPLPHGGGEGEGGDWRGEKEVCSGVVCAVLCSLVLC